MLSRAEEQGIRDEGRRRASRPEAVEVEGKLAVVLDEEEEGFRRNSR
jgi:hypothetical protein